MIQEPVGDSRPIVQVGIVRASSSQFEAIWHLTFSEGIEESLARQLQWHTIAVILHLSLSHSL